MAEPLVIAPSILSADFSKLGEEARAMAAAGADWLHIDVMDGHFVPNLTIGPDVMRCLRPHVALPFDVHLMVAPVDLHLEAFAKAGADLITVHAEAGPHLDRTLQAVRSLGCKAGVALCPATPAAAVAHVLDRLDLILVMSVNPGFGGQSFIPSQLGKLAELRAMIGSRAIRLEVDGGINARTAAQVIEAGADTLVAGSALFRDGAQNYRRNMLELRAAEAGPRQASA
ncbi:ribulose-phosphate 3-epimerase [Zavarzinia sp.]|uniref:ribulose-phosphate 3-epimerase n=1 Tax=Zavarzinia sp. TaxID=2027920 RepID=UPI00356A5481